MAKESVRLVFVSTAERKAFASARHGMLEAPIFGSDVCHQYLVEHADEGFVIQTKSFSTKKEAVAYCKEHPEARYLGKRPLATLFVV